MTSQPQHDVLHSWVVTLTGLAKSFKAAYKGFNPKHLLGTITTFPLNRIVSIHTVNCSPNAHIKSFYSRPTASFSSPP